jgi:hypothetical protein
MSNFFKDVLYGVHRQLPSLAHRCGVVAASNIRFVGWDIHKQQNSIAGGTSPIREARCRPAGFALVALPIV